MDYTQADLLLVKTNKKKILGQRELAFTWVCLGDTPLELGPLFLLEGSHKHATVLSRNKGFVLPLVPVTPTIRRAVAGEPLNRSVK